MFVRSSRELRVPFDRAVATFLRSPAGWLPGLAEAATGHGETLLLEVGFGAKPRLRKQMEVELGDPVRMGTTMLIPMRWQAASLAPLFPVLEADVSVVALGPHRSQVSVDGRYKPPLGAVGRMADRILLHRVAEATVGDFLDRVARELSDDHPGESGSGPRAPEGPRSRVR